MFILQKNNVVKIVDRIDKRDSLLAAGFCLVQEPSVKEPGVKQGRGGRGRKYDAIRDVKITVRDQQQR